MKTLVLDFADQNLVLNRLHAIEVPLYKDWVSEQRPTAAEWLSVRGFQIGDECRGGFLRFASKDSVKDDRLVHMEIQLEKCQAAVAVGSWSSWGSHRTYIKDFLSWIPDELVEDSGDWLVIKLKLPAANPYEAASFAQAVMEQLKLIQPTSQEKP